MLNAYADPVAFRYKVTFDGLDYCKSALGEEFANPALVNWCNKHNLVTDMSWAESFVRSCVMDRRRREPLHPLTIAHRDEWEIGLYTTSLFNCWDNDYVLFNRYALELWDTEINPWDIPFLVCPSRDRDGIINEIGFRVLDTERVKEAFKWLFCCGQQATYGLHRTQTKQLTMVEGCFDSIAFHASGDTEVVGLGSVRMTEGHTRQLAGYELSECWDQDTFGIAQRDKSTLPYKFFAPAGKDPFEAYCKNGSVKLISVAPSAC